MARRRGGRPKKTEAQKLKEALEKEERVQPNMRILARRKLFSFVQPPANKRQDGRNGEIDSEVCDAIGQLCALGYLDGHGYDPVELRDKGRFWGWAYTEIMKRLDAGTAAWEMPVDFSIMERFVGDGPMTGWRIYFEKMDEALGSGFERSALMSLVVDPLIGHRETVPWAQVLIDDELFKRGRFHSCMVIGGVTENDRHLLRATVRGLCALVEGSLPGRYERARAA